MTETKRPKGPCEAVVTLASLVAGGYIGYELGADAVEYARTLAENRNILEYVVNQHPVITKVVTTYGIGAVLGEIGKIAGELADLALGTRKDGDWY